MRASVIGLNYKLISKKFLSRKLAVSCQSHIFVTAQLPSVQLLDPGNPYECSREVQRKQNRSVKFPLNDSQLIQPTQNAGKTNFTSIGDSLP